MAKRGFLREAVLDSICDDFENVDQSILDDVCAAAVTQGFVINRTDIVRTLSELVEEGLAEAYILSPRYPHQTRCTGMPSLEEPESDFRTYFLITEAGRSPDLRGGRSSRQKHQGGNHTILPL